LCCSQSGDDPPEDLANFGYKLNITVTISNFYIFGYLLEPCIEIWIFFLRYSRIMAIINRKKLLILALLIFNTPFWLSIARKIKRCLQLLILALQCGSKRGQRHARGRTHERERERERERRDGGRGVGVARLI
jgi:hypothetical protein